MISMMLLQCSMLTGRTRSVVRLKHTIPSSAASGEIETVGRARLLMDGEMSRGSDGEDDEGRADEFAEDGEKIDINVMRRACIVV